LKNPILTASGTFGYGLEFEPYLKLDDLAGFVTKGLSPRPREGNPPPRIVETPAGMLNTIGLQNVGVDAFIRDKLPRLRGYDTLVIANVFGETEAEYVEVCRKLDQAEGVAAIELNVSCPNTEQGGMIFGNDATALEAITAASRKATRLPLIVKLSPNVTDIRETARAAVDGGADILSLVNTFVGMAIDVERRRPVLKKVCGGLSGPAIRPLAVWMTWQVRQAVDVPLIGMGGIVTAADALEFILAGASAVQVGTANFIHPDGSIRVLRELEDWLADRSVETLAELIGSGHPKAPA
ncbi:MAG: dihydroorotate dehydrogenase, partial [Acidobacteria bacterium]|nr:dihydroorotate dehydrogenase [Acidobacteriota bacterium]NIM63341.1 dihydroorotate dehydrogenase [Acidobacteriota bacterium]NIO57993.1 dihydroorotate dehydrogenase [Acidobacteriota bacterium]NIQ28995.1 dihydroorotate dehydrogenase [Acidobacteriota bacterium]NIQ83515.1 dihydroorotate dehydrogenase [Acidobacteriota bacterium]